MKKKEKRFLTKVQSNYVSGTVFIASPVPANVDLWVKELADSTLDDTLVFGIEMFGDAAVDKLTDILRTSIPKGQESSQNETLRYRAAAALGFSSVPPGRVTATLLGCLADRNELVRLAASVALVRLRPKLKEDFLDLIKRALFAEQVARVRSELAKIFIVGKGSRTENWVKVVQSFVTDYQAEVRDAALQALAQASDDSKTYAVVEKAFKRDNPNRITALKTLALLNPKKALSHLLPIIQEGFCVENFVSPDAFDAANIVRGLKEGRGHILEALCDVYDKSPHRYLAGVIEDIQRNKMFRVHPDTSSSLKTAPHEDLLTKKLPDFPPDLADKKAWDIMLAWSQAIWATGTEARRRYLAAVCRLVLPLWESDWPNEMEARGIVHFVEGKKILSPTDTPPDTWLTPTLWCTPRTAAAGWALKCAGRFRPSETRAKEGIDFDSLRRLALPDVVSKYVSHPLTSNLWCAAAALRTLPFSRSLWTYEIEEQATQPPLAVVLADIRDAIKRELHPWMAGTNKGS